jgi:hypothetical protein
MSSAYSDTSYPLDLDEDLNPLPHKSFHQLKYDLSRISESVLESVLKINQPDYSTTRALQEKLSSFEKEIPYQLRCQTAYLSLPSLHTDTGVALQDSPVVDKRNLTVTLQVSSIMVKLNESNSHSLSRYQKPCSSLTDRTMHEPFKSFGTTQLRLSTDSHI